MGDRAERRIFAHVFGISALVLRAQIDLFWVELWFADLVAERAFQMWPCSWRVLSCGGGPRLWWRLWSGLRRRGSCTGFRLR